MSDPNPPPVPAASSPVQLGDHVRELAWSPDSAQIAAALATGELVALEARAGLLARRWKAHDFGTLRVSWHPKEPFLLSGGEDGRVKVWDAREGQAVREDKMRGWVEHALWSPDGRFALAAAGKTLRVYDAQGATAFETSDHPSTIAAALWRADGNGFLTACFERVRLFRLGEPRPYQDLRRKLSHIAAAWSANGRHLAVGSQEGSVTYWKLPADGRDPLTMSGYAHKVRSLCWDPTSRWLATGGGELVTIWDVSGKGPAGTTPAQLKGHSARVTALAYQRRGDLLASGGMGGDVWLWRPSRGAGGMKTAQLEGEITALAWAPDERSVAIGTAHGEFLRVPLA
ncbi:MAG: WD40 repeat domain-containing protein [Verrucomicrobia bacterium]|nr:WD40 repeat domain-containing protein [Verrucomicrobiota bacterium]MBI3871108.1 WD40 repeat domain-containing protein [Verrucomicrobiota bacterium]